MKLKKLEDFKKLDISLQNNKDFVMSVIDDFPSVYYYLSPELREDEDIAFKVMTVNGGTFGFVFNELPKKLKDDHSFVVKCARNVDGILHFLTKEQKDDPEIMINILRNHTYDQGYRYFPLQLGVKLSNSKEFFLEAYEINKYSLKNFDSSILDKEVFLMLSNESNPCCEILEVFHKLSQDLKDDREIAINAIKHSNNIYLKLNDRLKFDIELIKILLNQNVFNYLILSPEISEDREIIEYMVEKVPNDRSLLDHISPKIGFMYYLFKREDNLKEKMIKQKEKKSGIIGRKKV